MNVRKNALLVLALLAASTADAQRAVGTRSRSLAAAPAIGMVTDAGGRSVSGSGANTDTIPGRVRFWFGPWICYGDSAITSDLSIGYVCSLGGEVWVVDLKASPPVLAPGVNPFEIPNFGLDLALTADDRFLVVCAGNDAPQEIAVIDLSTRTVTDQYFAGNCVAVEVGKDGSVLLASKSQALVRRLTLDASGHLTDTGETFAEINPVNFALAPSGRIGLLMGYEPSRLRSFTIPGLVPIDTLTPDGIDFPVGELADPS